MDENNQNYGVNMNGQTPPPQQPQQPQQPQYQQPQYQQPQYQQPQYQQPQYQQPQYQQPQQQYYGQTMQAKKVNAMCLVSFICSLVAWLVLGLPLGITAIITGIIGVNKFDEQTQNCRWMGIFGLIVGIIEVIVMIYWLTAVNTAFNLFSR